MLTYSRARGRRSRKAMPRFFLKFADVRIKFFKDANGKIERFEINANGETLLAMKVR